jgi:hypothetical protein
MTDRRLWHGSRGAWKRPGMGGCAAKGKSAAEDRHRKEG